jgi:ATP-dependent Clp protease ATP-binding subunit ClpC
VNGRPKYTDNASRVIAWAEEFAKQYGAEAMDTEHILLGLLKAEGGLARRVMDGLGVQPSVIQDELKKVIEKRPPGNVDSATPGAKRVIQNAQREAMALGHGWVGTEHILLALLREQEGLAALVLKKVGLEIESAREQVINLLREIQQQGTQQGGSPFPPIPGFPGFPGFTGHTPQERRGDRRRTPALETYGRDLTELAKKGALDPVIGREKEIERVIQILSRSDQEQSRS